MLNDSIEVLKKFLMFPISSSDDIFRKFNTIPGAKYFSGSTLKERYLYVPGSRSDRCVLVAHADTVWDDAYRQFSSTSKVVFSEGRFVSDNPSCGIGADDRAGCAILWILRNSGHSILLTDGEESGQIGANFLCKTNNELLITLNKHRFMLQLDRRGSNDYKFYHIPVTNEFRKYIETETNYVDAGTGSRTDICVLCRGACGVNLSIGYHYEHTPSEYLSIEEWSHTFELVRNMLLREVPEFD